MPSKRSLPRVCEYCGADFLTFPYYPKSGLGRFCSKRCSSLHWRSQQEYRPQYVERACGWCKRDFLARVTNVEAGKGRFCSHSCSVAHRNATTPHRAYTRQPRPARKTYERICPTCGGGFSAEYERAIYCSTACRDRRRREESNLRRFWSKVDKNGPTMPGMETPCWVWTGGTNLQGYGSFYMSGKGMGSATRFIYNQTHAEPLGDLEACHRCDNPLCVRPDHLFAGTHSDNMQDMIRKGRRQNSRGTANANVKLTPAEVLAIRAQLAVPNSKLARRYGVAAQTIAAIKNGRLWSHLSSEVDLGINEAVTTVGISTPDFQM